MSYAKTAATLDELRRLPVSHGELHQWVAAEGARIEATIVAETEAILGDQPTRAPTGVAAGDVWVQADGTMVHGRTGALFEARVGLVFRGTRRTGRTRRALIDRTYVAETANWTTFAERLVATCARLGVYDAERIFLVSDGAAAIRWIRERSFPTAIELLDWYHLTEQLKRGIGLAYPDVLAPPVRAESDERHSSWSRHRAARGHLTPRLAQARLGPVEASSPRPVMLGAAFSGDPAVKPAEPPRRPTRGRSSQRH